MNVLTPYIRQSDQAAQNSRHDSSELDAVQTELEAMHSIARALASIPETRTRARVMAWANTVFAIPASAHPAEAVDTDRTAESTELSEFLSEKVEAPAPPPAEVARTLSMIEVDPAAAQNVEALSANDVESLSIRDVEALFDDTRPPQGQFPPSHHRPRYLRPRLVLRFRLWR